MKVGKNRHSQEMHQISHGFEIACPLGQSKGHVIIKFMVVEIPLVEFDICSLELVYAN